MTRSKALLIAVGDPDILQCDVHWREFIHFCKDNGGYTGSPLRMISLPQQVEELTLDFSSLTTDAAGD
jgi:helicase MOV-10